MRLFLKAILLFSTSVIIILNAGDTTIRTRMNQPYYSNEKDTSGRYFVGRENPAMVREIRFREMNDGGQNPRMEEIRIQRVAERTANTEWIKTVTQKYSPDSWYLLMSYDSLPLAVTAPAVNSGTVSSVKTIETFDYLRGRTRGDLLSSMEKNVHEISHAYFDQNVFRYVLKNNIEFNPENASGFIYIDPQHTWFVSFPLKAMFPSARLRSVIPASSKTFRYETYITGQTSTQSDGVIGLLNELHAYYLGSRYCFEMLEAYKSVAGSDASGLYEWVTHTQSTMSAFYEFDFFIREYLLYMKRNYTSNYELLRSCKPFTESYKMLLVDYNSLINKYISSIDNEIKSINSSGEAEASLADGWLWIKTAGSHISSGTPVFSEDKDKLLPVLESRRYRDIDTDFNIK